MANESRTRVFAITELLEGILLHIEPRKLLTLAQLVQRRWRDVIRDSPALQQKLYLRGTPDRSPSRQEMNRMLKPCFPFFVDERPFKLHDSFPQMTWNEMFNQDNPSHSECQAHTITYDDLLTSQPRAGNAKRLEALLRPEASWRKMLVAQPPIRRVGLVRCALNVARDAPYRTAELDMRRRQHDSSDGLRMGELYDAVAAWVRVPRPGTGRLCIVWNPSAAHPVPNRVTTDVDDSNLQALKAVAERVDLLLELPEPIAEHKSASEAWERIFEFQFHFMSSRSYEKLKDAEEASNTDILAAMWDLYKT